ncbi:MAG: PilW family protein [Granulosicoccaceae bacterium]
MKIPQKITLRKQLGFSLIELLIASMLGIMLVGGVITVFSGTKRSSAINSNLTELQENARFALESIMREARMAGFQGCVDINTASASIKADAAPTDNLYATAVQSSVVTTPTQWTPAPPMNFNIPVGIGAPVPGTHTLSIQGGSPETFALNPMQRVDDPIVLAGPTDNFVEGDLALISNCQVADIVTITAVGGATLAHDGSGNGGDDRLSATYGQAGAQNRARIMRFEANIFYIGNTTRRNSSGDPVYALYRQTLPYSRPPIEMVEGVDNMRIRLGYRDPSSKDNLTLSSPNAAAPVGQIETVQIGLLLQSIDPVTDVDDNKSYFLAGDQILPAGASGAQLGLTHAGDRRLRMAFSSSVTIRNRR